MISHLALQFLSDVEFLFWLSQRHIRQMKSRYEALDVAGDFDSYTSVQQSLYRALHITKQRMN